MNYNYEYGIFIFRKDLRIIDNYGLIELNEKCKYIIPIFIFDKFQVISNNENKNYQSIPALRFICESVINLQHDIYSLKNNNQLYIFYGDPINTIKYIINFFTKKNKKICFGFNGDFTKYSLLRDNNIIELCKNVNIPLFINNNDMTLCDMNLLKKKNDITAYKQFAAFKKNLILNIKNIKKPNLISIHFYNKKIKFKYLITNNEINLFWSNHLTNIYNPLYYGKRQNALNILSNLNKFYHYNDKKNTLSYETTRLSSYLNFGLISEREFYFEIINQLGISNPLLDQIYWRDYYLCMLRFLDGANSYTNHIDNRYNNIKWYSDFFNTKYNTKYNKILDEWNLMMKSKTGFLIIDAAIQELLHTGYMHNRSRLIVGFFAIKYLKINPLSRYIGLNDWFSRHLIDCSTSQNKLNCQWITELDFSGKKYAPSNSPISGRPMIISNIIIKKFDNDCIYIKKWLPHLKNVPNKILYNWDTKYDINIHPKPIFDSKKRYLEWIELCSK
jgi:deoxyribodipyrimidine photo-lyase